MHSHPADPDWCTCEPGGADRCEYRMLADAVSIGLNPHDGDEAEVSLLVTAVEKATAYILSLPCACEPGYSEEPCQRCAVTGRWHDVHWQYQ